MIGKNIKEHRKQKGLSQKELAELIAVTDKAISSWECGRAEPSIQMIERLSIIFGCTKTALIGETAGNEDEALLKAFHEASEERKNDIRFLLRMEAYFKRI